MTQFSNFQARADSAALALKGRLTDKFGKPLQPRSVPVGPNGQPASPLPPEGSYARQAIEHQRAAAQQRANPQMPVQPVQPPEQQVQPMEHEGYQQADQQPQDNHQFSPNAQRRFSELSETLRRKDQELQQAQARSRALEETYAQAIARAEQIEARYNQLVNQNLDSLDPDTRQQVLQQAAIAESAAQIEQRVMQRVAPIIDRVTTNAIQAELNEVARKYPAFDATVHGPLIQIFRQQNPNCSIEQAFRAVAEPEELVRSPQGRAPAIPPVAIPQSINASPRYVQQPQPKTTPEQELEEDRRRAFELARSSNPQDRRSAERAMEHYISQKLGNRLPGRR
jgi:hypothetical protein